MARLHALVLAAGESKRFGGSIPKQLLNLGGCPVVERAVRPFAEAGADPIVVVTSGEAMDDVAKALAGRRVTLVEGGATRVESVRAGLAALDAHRDDLVLIHDAARPLVDQDTVQRCLAALHEADAVTVVSPTVDTILEVELGSVVAVPPRSRMFRAQTPQGFRFGVISSAHEAAAAARDMNATDDCGVVRAFRPDVEIAVVMGTPRNLKITTPDDLIRAERLVAEAEAVQHTRDADEPAST